MPSECIQALSPGISELNSPESLYMKDGHNVSLLSPDLMKPIGKDPLVAMEETKAQTSDLHTLNILCLNSGQPLCSFEGLTSMLNAENMTMDHVPKDEDMMGHHDNTLLSCNESAMVSGELSSPCSQGSYSPLSSPGLLSPVLNSSVTPPMIMNEETQMSLCNRSEALQLADEISNMDANSILSLIQGELSDESEKSVVKEETRKALKLSADSDALTSSTTSPNTSISGGVFDADGAVSSCAFVFSTLGQANPVFTSALPSSDTITNTSSVVTTSGTVFRTVAATQPTKEKTEEQLTILQAPPIRRLKVPSLTLGFPAKSQGCELKILVQPEQHHRARYQTEGSRGAVKDESQQGYPEVQLLGCKQQVTLQVFIGNDAGKVKPHGFYQACRVPSKNSTPSSEQEIEGTKVIEKVLDVDTDMKAVIDCVGILKLRNSDVEKRIGLARSKKRSTKARMVFRVNIPKPDGSYITLQAASAPILCTQPAGQPEVCKKSRVESPVTGGEELFIIGKNFSRNSQVIFREMDKDAVVWSAEGAVDMDHFQPTHIVCGIPPYKSTTVTQPVDVELVVSCGGKISDPQKFTYKPVIQAEVPSPTLLTASPCVAATSPVAFVAPEALAWNKLFELASQCPTGSNDAVSLLLSKLTQGKGTAGAPSVLQTAILVPQQATQLQSQDVPMSCPSDDKQSEIRRQIREEIVKILKEAGAATVGPGPPLNCVQPPTTSGTTVMPKITPQSIDNWPAKDTSRPQEIVANGLAKEAESRTSVCSWEAHAVISSALPSIAVEDVDRLLEPNRETTTMDS